jgi:hypothetical protein
VCTDVLLVADPTEAALYASAMLVQGMVAAVLAAPKQAPAPPTTTKLNNVVHARKLLHNLARTLRAEHPSAAASLEEGLEETLTVMAMKLPRSLERVLSTTNVIENLIGSTRDLSARVKRWRDGEMIVRWTATAVRESATKFRCIAGHKDMPRLVRVLRAHDALSARRGSGKKATCRPTIDESEEPRPQ